MGWDDKESDKDKKDPWSGKNKEQGPPDLDQVFKEVGKKFTRLFSFGKKTTSGGGDGGNSDVKHTWLMVLVILVVLVIIWFLSGFYIVGPAKQSVVLRFGKYYETENSGWHWIPRFVDSKTIVNIQQVENFSYQAEMLTEDENIVHVEIAVQYRISDPMQYLYNVVNPEQTVQQATASALRQVVGNMTLDTILTTGREGLTEKVDTQLQQTLKRYHVGVDIVAVTLQPARPPEQVKSAFNDAIKAREDEITYQNQASAYASKVVPIAQGQAKRIVTEAHAYEQQIVLNAKAQVASFLAVLPQYKLAPKVTRERLYLSTVESMLQHSSKILLSAKDGQNIMYLPLQKLLQLPNPNQSSSSDASERSDVASMASTVSSSVTPPSQPQPSQPSSSYAGNGYSINVGGRNEGY